MLTSDQEYGAVDAAWEAAGATLVRAPVESLWEHATDADARALALARHLADGLVVPVEELLPRGRASWGSLSVVDGAHAPGHVPVDLAALGADAYAGNCHKWLCAPKGAGFLGCGRSCSRGSTRSSSPGAGTSRSSPRHAGSGTRDPAAWLAVPAAIEFQREWGWDEVRARCHALVERFRGRAACRRPRRFGQMVVRAPAGDPEGVQLRLWDEHRIEVPCFELERPAAAPALGAGLQHEEDIDGSSDGLPARKSMRLAGIEPATSRSGGARSIP